MTQPTPKRFLGLGFPGRSLEVLLGLLNAGLLNIDLRLVISSSPKAGGLEIARSAKIPTKIVERTREHTDICYRDALREELLEPGGLEALAAWSPDEAEDITQRQRLIALQFRETKSRITELADKRGFSLDDAIDKSRESHSDHDMYGG